MVIEIKMCFFLIWKEEFGVFWTFCVCLWRLFCLFYLNSVIFQFVLESSLPVLRKRGTQSHADCSRITGFGISAGYQISAGFGISVPWADEDSYLRANSFIFRLWSFKGTTPIFFWLGNVSITNNNSIVINQWLSHLYFVSLNVKEFSVSESPGSSMSF